MLGYLRIAPDKRSHRPDNTNQGSRPIASPAVGVLKVKERRTRISLRPHNPQDRQKGHKAEAMSNDRHPFSQRKPLHDKHADSDSRGGGGNGRQDAAVGIWRCLAPCAHIYT